MKKTICFFLCALLLICIPFKASAYSARSLVVIEQTTHTVIESVNRDKKMPMASTTKIMTALVVLERADLDDKVKIPKEACGVEGSSMYLVEGETLTVTELLYGLMLTSGNDAATALAVAVSGSEPAFVRLMNEKANELGLTSTHFANPSGLPDDDHYTTAYELGIIAATALQNELFLQIVGTKSKRVPYNNNEGGRLLVNHNKLLSMYEYAVGVKTGFTKKAGRCLVSAAKKDGVILVCVTLNAPDDWNDHINALENAFEKTRYVTVAKSGEVTAALLTPDGKKVSVSNNDDIVALSIDGHPLTQKIYAPRFIYAPKAKGQTVATVCYFLNGKTVATVPLCMQSALDIHIQKELLITKILKYIKGLFR